MAEWGESKGLAAAADLTGTTVGRFVVRAKLGEGGMGQVYRAEDTKLKRSVALKRISPYLRNDEHYRHRFLKEAERASNLSYEHIAGVYDVFEENSEIFIVMEYVEGETLRHHLRQAYSVSEFLSIAVQCAEALVAAHEKGIAHRDLKPENIMLSPRGQVKILDFGIAKLLPHARDAAATESLQSATGGFSGTVAYAAPEALLEQDTDERADIFSLGVVFYEMLAGQHPFRVVGYTATTNRILHATPEPLGQLNPAVSADLEQIIHKMLAKDPAERYASAVLLLADLRRLERGEPVRPTPAVRRVVRPAPWRPELRLTPRTVLAVAALLAVVLAVGYIAWKHWLAPPRERIRVAVVPFANQTGQAGLDAIRLTLTEVLISDLTGSPNIQVYPYEQLAKIMPGLEAQGIDISSANAIQALASFSGSQYVVVPRMMAFGDTLRLQADFRNAVTGETIATRSAEGQLSGTTETTYYGLLGNLTEEIQKYFKEIGRGKEYRSMPTGSRPKSVPAASHFTEGKTLFVQGEYDRALRAFERATQEDPDYALAYAWMGRIYSLLGYDEKAREVSQEAFRRISPQMPTVESAFIEATLAVSKYDFATAEAKYLDLIRWYPDEAVRYASLASVYQKQGRFPEAIAQYQQALQRDTNYVSAHQELATLFRKTGDLEQAAAQANKALELCRALRNREGEAYALLESSEVSRVKGEYREAEDRAQQGLQIFEAAQNAVGIGLANLRLGNLRFHQGDYEGARRYWQRLLSSAGEIRNNRDVVTGLMNIGVSYSREGKLGETIKYYEQALSQQWPALWEQAQVKSNLATIYIEYGIDPERGLALAQEALRAFEQTGDRPWVAQSRVTLSIYYTNTGQYPAALDQVQQAQAIWRSIGNKERLALAIFAGGRVHFVQNQYEQALKAFAEALALAEETQDSFRKADSQIHLGLTYQRLGDWARAKTLLEEGFRSVQENDFGEMLPQAHAALGELYWERGERERARASFQQAARLSREPAIPEFSVEARADLGLLEAEQQDLGRGLAHCREAVAQARQLKSRHILARALIQLARVHLLRKDYEQAIRALDEVAAMETLGLEYRAQTYYARGQALRSLGRAEEAKASYQKARDTIQQLQQTLDPEHRESFAARPDIQVLLR